MRRTVDWCQHSSYMQEGCRKTYATKRVHDNLTSIPKCSSSLCLSSPPSLSQAVPHPEPGNIDLLSTLLVCQRAKDRLR